MEPALFRIIIVEDDAAHAEAIKRALKDSGMNAQVDVAVSIRDFRRYLAVSPPDIALVDMNLPDGRAIDVLTSPPEAGAFPVLVMTGHGDEQTAVEAMKAGAIDYIVKSPHAFVEMPRIVVRTLREWRLLIERRHAEKALQIKEQRYRHLFENMLEGFALCRMKYVDGVPHDFIYLEVNGAFEQLTGLTNVAGKKVSEVIPGVRESNPELLEIYGRVASTGKPERFETYLPSLGIWFAISVYSPERDYFVSVFDNITERKKADVALSESEQNYRTLADSGQALIWATGTDKLCNYFNRAWLEFTGRQLAQELGNGWAEGVHPDDLQHGLDMYTAAFDRRDPFSVDYRLKRHDGEYRWLQNDGCPRYDSSGKFIGYIGYCLDITERKFADQIVVAQRTELAAIYENAPFIMLLIDQECRVVKVNKLGTAFADKLAAEMIGERGGEALQCLHALDDPKGCGFGPHCEQCVLRRSVTDTFETGRVHDQVEATMQFIVKGGEQESTVLLSTSRLVLGSKTVVLVTLLDITERRRLEQETRHAQTKLIHANKMSSLGMLVSSVSHEVNNPNNFIMFNSSLLAGAWKDMMPVLDRNAAEDPGFRIAGLPYAEMREAVPKLLTGITEGSRRIKDMVDRLRELSREDRSGLNGAVDVNNTVRSALMILQNEIMKHTDDFSIDLADPLPVVTGSPQQIEQVVINLVQNALQALGNRKQAVSVRTFADKEQRRVVIEVKDGGGGIVPKDLQRISEPFFTTKLDAGGTGLGLSISSSIIRDHRGRIDFESEEGKGTMVQVVLPYGNEEDSSEK